MSSWKYTSMKNLKKKKELIVLIQSQKKNWKYTSMILVANFLSSHSRTDLPGMMRKASTSSTYPLLLAEIFRDRTNWGVDWIGSHGYYCKNLWIWINPNLFQSGEMGICFLERERNLIRGFDRTIIHSEILCNWYVIGVLYFIRG